MLHNLSMNIDISINLKIEGDPFFNLHQGPCLGAIFDPSTQVDGLDCRGSRGSVESRANEQVPLVSTGGCKTVSLQTSQ
jgi:hypothetical protein